MTKILNLRKKIPSILFAAMILKLLLWALFFNLACSSNDDFIFNGFRGAELILDNEAAISSDGLLMLTHNTSNEKGEAFYSKTIQFRSSTNSKVSSFSSTFVFAIVADHLKTGSGGFSFAITPSKDFSSSMSDQFLGLFNSTNNYKPSNHIVAVEFDTVDNPDFNDRDDNHVGIDVNGLISAEAHYAGYFSGNRFENLTLISGQEMQAWIEYNGVANELNVTLSPLHVPKPSIPLLQYTIDLSSTILADMYVGFTASTSEADLYYSILAWSFKIDGKAQQLDLSNLPKLPRSQSQPTGSSSKSDNLAVWLPSVIVVSVLACLIAAILILKRRNKYAELIEGWEKEFGPHRFSYKDLFRATKGFKDKYLLGAGGFGKVYKGVLPVSEIEVAVKRISHESRQGVREFVAEIAILGRLRHRNLVQLLGYCRRKGELLIVYDFMLNGSLDTFLFEDVKLTLSWPQRFHIIKGVASGLVYLHEDWEKVVIHRDVKASNVLLDRELNGRLGDFGLARLYDHGSDPHTTHVVGTTGYLAPELTRTGKATTATDVFAFGAFLLEVACGRRPIEPEKSCEDTILVDWVFLHWQRGAILETVDAKLREEYAVEEAELVLKLGLLCSHPVAAMRPSMRQVTQFLDGDAPLPEEVMPDRMSDTVPMLGTGDCNDCIMSYPYSASAGSDLSGGR